MDSTFIATVKAMRPADCEVGMTRRLADRMRSDWDVVRVEHVHDLGRVDIYAKRSRLGVDEIAVVEVKQRLTANWFQHAVGQALCAKAHFVRWSARRHATTLGVKVGAYIASPEAPSAVQEMALRHLDVGYLEVPCRTR